MLPLKFKKLVPHAMLPTVATPGSACFDFYALEGCCLEQGESWTFDLGLAVEVPQHHVMLMFSHSGHGFKYHTRLRNCVGVIDSDYRDELKVLLHKEFQYLNEHPIDLVIHPGDRIAQGLVLPLPHITIIEADELSTTERGGGGFGSTGT